MSPLPDYLRDGLPLVSIGLNPSPASVAAGFYFAHPRNRFWRALNASGLIPAAVTPGPCAHELLLRDHGLGFTDVVKRPSAGGAQLRAGDYRRWAPSLRGKLARFRPAIAWFHGKVAYAAFIQHAAPELKGVQVTWGEQGAHVEGCLIFVTPHPSPANAAFSLDDLSRWYRSLARVRAETS